MSDCLFTTVIASPMFVPFAMVTGSPGWFPASSATKKHGISQFPDAPCLCKFIMNHMARTICVTQANKRVPYILTFVLVIWIDIS